MNHCVKLSLAILALMFSVCLGSMLRAADIIDSKLGIFSDQADVGDVAKPGAVEFNSKTGEYLITGGGENIWNTNDAFHFIWKKMSGDFIFTANVRFTDTNGAPHRKACLLVRQSLTADSPYADIAFHGVGMTSFQYRDASGELTHEIRSDLSAPARVRLEKRGDYYSMSVAAAGEELKLNAGYVSVPLQGDLFVGLAVCAHDNKTVAKTAFSDVQLVPVSTPADAKPALENTLETVNISSTDRSVVYHTRDHIEAANWTPDGKYFIFNGVGRIY